MRWSSAKALGKVGCLHKSGQPEDRGNAKSN